MKSDYFKLRTGKQPRMNTDEHGLGISNFKFEISNPKIQILNRKSQIANRKFREAAFTLIELLLVLVILGILAAIVVPKFAGRTEQARQTAAQSQLTTFGTALDAFEIDNGYYPKGKNGLQDLVQQPRDSQQWKGPYLKSD